MPSELEVTAVVSPPAPNSSTDGGLLALTIMVRNPFPHPVIALLRSFSGATARSYPYDVRGATGGMGGAHLAFDAGVTYFSGTYTFRAGYGDHLAEIAGVVVSQ